MPKLLAAAVVLLVTTTAASPARAIDRPPMQSCGAFTALNGLLFADLTARRGS